MENNKFTKIISAVLTVILIVTLLCGITAAARPYENLRENLFRLHIIANSNSAEDQALKLAVRDAMLPKVKELFDELDIETFAGDCYAQKTANAARSICGRLSAIAQQAVYACGSTMTAAVMVGYETFPQKTYDTLTVPAGEYHCLRIVLGAGKGENWWCVLYPPLCISPAVAEQYFTKEEMDILSRPEQYRFRFAIWEWLKKRYHVG